MYVYAPNKTAKKFPYSIGDLGKDNPNTSFPRDPSLELLAEYDVYPVVMTGAPDHDPMTQAVEQNGCAYDTERQRWETTWAVRDKTAEELQADQQALIASITAATQERLDTFARTRNYDGILSACTYASSTVPKFQAEGQYCVNARDATWYALYQFMAEVEAGQRPVPIDYADVEPSLPALEWPV